MTLDAYRAQLAEKDQELALLWQERMDLVVKIARLKEQSELPVLDRGLEKQKIKAVSALVRNEYRPYIEELFEKLFDLSRAYQQALREKDVKRR